MIRRRSVPLALAAVTAAVAVAVPALGAGATKGTVKVVDVKFTPSTLTLHCKSAKTCGAKVTWKWNHDVASHNVDLKSAPKGVKRFKVGGPHGTPTTYRKPYTYTFRKAGTYRFVCDVHSFMTLKITVKR